MQASDDDAVKMAAALPGADPYAAQGMASGPRVKWADMTNSPDQSSEHGGLSGVKASDHATSSHRPEGLAPLRLPADHSSEPAEEAQPAAVAAAGATPRSNAWSASVIRFLTAVIIGFGLSMFLNSIAQRMLPHRPDSYRLSHDASLGVRLASAMAWPVFSLGSGRSLALVCIMIWMVRKGDVPWKLPGVPGAHAVPGAAEAAVPAAGAPDAAAPAAAPPPATATAVSVAPAAPVSLAAIVSSIAGPDIVGPRLLYCIAIGAFNALGYACYMALTAMAGVASWSAMIACYVVLPVSYGILRRGESSGPKKIVGVVCCTIAALLLGFSGNTRAPAAQPEDGSATLEHDLDGPFIIKLLLFSGCVFSWAFADGASAYVLNPKPVVVHKHHHVPGEETPRVTAVHYQPPPLHLFSVVTFISLGFLLVAWMAAGLALIAQTFAPPFPAGLTPEQLLAITPDVTVEVPNGWAVFGAHLLLFAGNLAGMCALYSIIKLGALAEASSFLPLVALDAFVPGLLGIAFMGESMGGGGYAGMALAIAGVTLIATTHK